MQRLFVLVCTALALMPYGCVTTPDTAALQATASAQHAPMLIYFTSWNDIYARNDRMKVGLLNMQADALSSVELQVSTCGIKGSVWHLGHLTLKGPFPRGQLRIVYPRWSQKELNTTVGFSAHHASHLVITSIQLNAPDGANQSFTGKEVSRLLSKNISNYCPLEYHLDIP